MKQRGPGKFSHPIKERIMEAVATSGRTWKEVLELCQLGTSYLSGNKIFYHFEIEGAPGQKPVLSPMPLKYSFVTNIAFVLNMDPRDLLLSEKEERLSLQHLKGSEHLYFLREKHERISEGRTKNGGWKDFWTIPNFEKDGKEQLVKIYESAKEYYVNAKSSIVASEVLLKGNQDNPAKESTYREAQRSVHLAIEKTLRRHAKANNKDFRYERTFHLSVSERLYNRDDEKEKVCAFVSEASRGTLRHILICSREFPELCNFYLVANGSSLRQYVTIDEEYLLIEDYGLHDGKIMPESVGVYDVREGSPFQKQLTFVREVNTRYEKELLPTTDYQFFRKYLEMAIHFTTEQEMARDKGKKGLTEDGYGNLFSQVQKTQRLYEAQKMALEQKLNHLDGRFNKQ